MIISKILIIIIFRQNLISIFKTCRLMREHTRIPPNMLSMRHIRIIYMFRTLMVALLCISCFSYTDSDPSISSTVPFSSLLSSLPPLRSPLISPGNCQLLLLLFMIALYPKISSAFTHHMHLVAEGGICHEYLWGSDLPAPGRSGWIAREIACHEPKLESMETRYLDKAIIDGKIYKLDIFKGLFSKELVKHLNR